MSHTPCPAPESAAAPMVANSANPAQPGSRLASLDAYRGWVMLLMMGEVLRFCAVSAALPGNAFWKFLCQQQSHVAWIGCSLHDLIQPSFSFLVGAALPFSLARRSAQGQSAARRTVHAFWRALILVLLGVFLRSTGRPTTYWTFEDTLTQIGLGYGFLYLLALSSVRVQWSAIVFLLGGYWLAFAWYPLPADATATGPGQLAGFAAHWSKNTNLAWAFDTWFLNLFSREHPFTGNSGGYATLSFIPTLATMLLGLLAGQVLRSSQAPREKTRWLAIAGASAIAAALALQFLGLCPIVKRIWTPSWTLFSGGCCFLLLLAFHRGLDGKPARRWAFPLAVVGMNSIAAYLIAHLFEGFISSALTRHAGAEAFAVLGKTYQPLMLGAAVLAVEWLLLWWMFRRKIFLRI